MDDLIRRSDILESLGDRPENRMDSDEEIQACADWDAFHGIVTRLPAVDAVEVDTVCDMFMYVMRDECPCNYCGVDEWLPEACELIDECPHPTDKMGCWKQFIKHYPTRMDYMDSLAAEAEKKRMDGRREDGDVDG